MPSTSLKQQHMMQMALAVKRGHRIEGIDESTRAKLHEMAEDMSEMTLGEFATRRRRGKTVLTQRKE